MSHLLFNIIVYDLQIELKESAHKVSIGSFSTSSFSYADDITLMCTSIPGLQILIDICTKYARKWRFKFSINKTKCMVIAGNCLAEEPKWFLNNVAIENVCKLEILGVHFSNVNGDKNHVENRTTKFRNSFYSLRDVGLAYPGCDSNVKAYLFKTMCQPVLTYGLDALSISKASLNNLETVQGNLVKQALGLNKHAKSTKLLQAFNVDKVEDKVRYNTASLLYRIFCVDSPVQELTKYFLSLYICDGILYTGTLIDRIVSYGLSPTYCMFNRFSMPPKSECGLVDSLRVLLSHSNFIKPYSEEHVLSSLLTKAF